jgi:hypothetical protein
MAMNTSNRQESKHFLCNDSSLLHLMTPQSK